MSHLSVTERLDIALRESNLKISAPVVRPAKGTRIPVIGSSESSPKITWKGSDIPSLVRMMRREYESKATRHADGVDTMHRVNLMSMVKAIVNELHEIQNAELHLNSAMGCAYGSLRYVVEGRTFWSLPVPDAISNEMISMFKVMSNMDSLMDETERSIRWNVNNRESHIKVMAKPTHEGHARLVVWIESPIRD